jgi:predicted nucleic-acid-binding protein
LIGLDTNVVLRYLLQDDRLQTLRVNDLIDRQISEVDPGFINLATVLEIVWVLRSAFQRTPVQIAAHLEHLLAVDLFHIQNEQQVFEAAYALKHGMGEFEDALIGTLNAWAGCSYTVTFDKKATRLAHFRGL